MFIFILTVHVHNHVHIHVHIQVLVHFHVHIDIDIIIHINHISTCTNYSIFVGKFNWSMTYRSDSDVPVPYGRVVRNTQGKASTMHHKRNFHGEKEHVVAILASNCGGKSGRYHFLDSLIKSVPV